MKPSKKTIRESFSGAAGTYDLHSDLQKDVAIWLADRVRAFNSQQLQPHTGAACGTSMRAAIAEVTTKTACALKVLDIGCGTGNMAVLIRDILTDASIYATDLSIPMLEKTRERLGAGSLLAASDCEALPFTASAFDIIVSSLAYQWAQDTDEAFKEAARVLRPGGRIFLATLGTATLNELRECYIEASQGKGYPGPESYPDSVALKSSLNRAGFELISIERQTVMRRYTSLTSLIRTLKKIGAAPVQNNKTGRPETGMTLRRAGRIYAEKYSAPEGGVIATYEVILVSAKKI